MSISVSMPQLGESVSEGTIGRWLKSVGDRVELDEPIVEIITDKVNVEVPSPGSGIIVLIVAAEGQTVPVGSEIAIIDSELPIITKPESSVSRRAEVSASSQMTGKSTESGVSAVVVGPIMPQDEANVAVAEIRSRAEPSSGRPASVSILSRTTPFVHGLAEEHDIDLQSVAGTGLGGRVSKQDLLSYLAERGIAASTVVYDAVSPQLEPRASASALSQPERSTQNGAATAGDASSWEPLSSLRRAIAENTTISASHVPHARVSVEIDMTGVANARAAISADFQQREGFDLSYIPFVARAVIESLRDYPRLNATYAVDSNGNPGIKNQSQVHLSLVVGLQDGLMVPVIRSADGLSVVGLARAANDLIKNARDGKLAPSDVSGGTFTLNNTGALGSVASDPILNGGQAAIMTMEAIMRRPVVVKHDSEEAIVIRSMMMSVLTFDHRVLDGLQAGQFMRSVKKRLESIGIATTIY